MLDNDKADVNVVSKNEDIGVFEIEFELQHCKGVIVIDIYGITVT